MPDPNETTSQPTEAPVTKPAAEPPPPPPPNPDSQAADAAAADAQAAADAEAAKAKAKADHTKLCEQMREAARACQRAATDPLDGNVGAAVGKVQEIGAGIATTSRIESDDLIDGPYQALRNAGPNPSARTASLNDLAHALRTAAQAHEDAAKAGA